MAADEMNWVDETVASAHSNPADVADVGRSVCIDVGMTSVKDYGYMGVSVTADGVDDLPAAVAMIQAAIAAAPAEFTAEPDESVPMPDMGEMD